MPTLYWCPHQVLKVTGAPDYICLNTSCHGGNWAMKITSTKLKIFCQFWVIFFSCCMVGAVILTFLYPEQPITIFTWKENDGSFPNITLCSNRIFDEKKVQKTTRQQGVGGNFKCHLESPFIGWNPGMLYII